MMMQLTAQRLPKLSPSVRPYDPLDVRIQFSLLSVRTFYIFNVIQPEKIQKHCYKIMAPKIRNGPETLIVNEKKKNSLY